jgi:hypothetical protein
VQIFICAFVIDNLAIWNNERDHKFEYIRFGFKVGITPLSNICLKLVFLDFSHNKSYYIRSLIRVVGCLADCVGLLVKAISEILMSIITK